MGYAAQKSQSFMKTRSTKTKKPILKKYATKIALYLIRKKVWPVFTENTLNVDRSNIKKKLASSKPKFPSKNIHSMT